MKVSLFWLQVYALLASFASTGTMFMAWGLGSMVLLKHGINTPVLVGVYETIPAVIFLETVLMGAGVIASITSLFYLFKMNLKPKEPPRL